MLIRFAHRCQMCGGLITSEWFETEENVADIMASGYGSETVTCKGGKHQYIPSRFVHDCGLGKKGVAYFAGIEEAQR